MSLEAIKRAFNQEVDVEYASTGHAALTGLVAGYLRRLKADQPFVLNVGHADGAGIPVIVNEGPTPPKRYVVIVVPVDD